MNETNNVQVEFEGMDTTLQMIEYDLLRIPVGLSIHSRLTLLSEPLTKFVQQLDPSCVATVSDVTPPYYFASPEGYNSGIISSG